MSRVSICTATRKFVLKGLDLPATAEKYIVLSKAWKEQVPHDLHVLKWISLGFRPA